MERDGFTQANKIILKDRVGGRCSNPLCRRETLGPKATADKAVLVGEAAHICAASPNGPRYNQSMSDAERKSVLNGIWLCATCHTLVDNDPDCYSEELLKKWKADAEYEQLCRLKGTDNFEVVKEISKKQEVLQMIKETFDTLYEILVYAYTFWESNLSNMHNEIDMQNEIDNHWYMYQENFDEITKYKEYAKDLNMLLKKNSLLIGKKISTLIENFLEKLYFHFQTDSIGFYDNFWSSFFVMLEKNYENLLDIKEEFDEACFKAYQNDVVNRI